MNYKTLCNIFEEYSKTLRYYPHSRITPEDADLGIIEWEQHPDYILEAWEEYMLGLEYTDEEEII